MSAGEGMRLKFAGTAGKCLPEYVPWQDQHISAGSFTACGQTPSAACLQGSHLEGREEEAKDVTLAPTLETTLSKCCRWIKVTELVLLTII